MVSFKWEAVKISLYTAYGTLLTHFSRDTVPLFELVSRCAKDLVWPADDSTAANMVWYDKPMLHSTSVILLTPGLYTLALQSKQNPFQKYSQIKVKNFLEASFIT